MTPESLGALVASIAADPAAWQPRVRLPRRNEQRWWTCLSANALVDVWLLSWLPGQATDLHDHGRSAAAFVVVRGKLAEVRVDAGGRWSRHARETGDRTSMPPGLVHDVHGAGVGPAVSIHAYSPPLRCMTFYDRDADGRLCAVRSVATEEPELEPVG